MIFLFLPRSLTFGMKLLFFKNVYSLVLVGPFNVCHPMPALCNGASASEAATVDVLLYACARGSHETQSPAAGHAVSLHSIIYLIAKRDSGSFAIRILTPQPGKTESGGSPSTKVLSDCYFTG